MQVFRAAGDMKLFDAYECCASIIKCILLCQCSSDERMAPLSECNLSQNSGNSNCGEGPGILANKEAMRDVSRMQDIEPMASLRCSVLVILMSTPHLSQPSACDNGGMADSSQMRSLKDATSWRSKDYGRETLRDLRTVFLTRCKSSRSSVTLERMTLISPDLTRALLPPLARKSWV